VQCLSADVRSILTGQEHIAGSNLAGLTRTTHLSTLTLEALNELLQMSHGTNAHISQSIIQLPKEALREMHISQLCWALWQSTLPCTLCFVGHKSSSLGEALLSHCPSTTACCLAPCHSAVLGQHRAQVPLSPTYVYTL
jgi:hypothetical protein